MKNLGNHVTLFLIVIAVSLVALIIGVVIGMNLQYKLTKLQQTEPKLQDPTTLGIPVPGIEGVDEMVVECTYDDPNKKYLFKGLDSCYLAFISCPEDNEKPFTDECGCGCEKIIDKNQMNLCTDPPQGTAIGRDVFPINQKYDNLDFLGQIFTAYECGEERMQNIFGVDGDKYSLGSNLLLWQNSNPELTNLLKSIGFNCNEEVPDESCEDWDLIEIISIEDLMQLEPYHIFFEVDDCIHCG